MRILDLFDSPCVAAHRGLTGGNIPPNSIEAYKAAVFQGAKVIEMDVARSRDGVFYNFHTGNEAATLGVDAKLEDLTSQELDSLVLFNEYRKPTEYRLPRFEDVLENLRGKAILNLDRCWQYLDSLIPVIEKHGMRNQILLKTPCQSSWIEAVKTYAPEYAFMPMINDDMQAFLECGAMELEGFCGAELVFQTETSPLIQENAVKWLHERGKFAWANSLVYSYKRDLCAGHNDDISMTGNIKEGWQWLLEHGFDIIQTDWVGEVYALINRLYSNPGKL